MSDNFTAKDASGSTITFDSDDIGAGVQAPRRVIREVMAGASVDIGAVSDAAVDTDANGSVNAHVRGIVKILAARLWASLGQKTSANSTPVVIASDQSVLEVGQKLTLITPTITVDTVVYGAGDSIGGKITLANALRVSGGLAVLKMLSVLDRSNQKPEFDLLIFDSDPSAATITDNAAFVYSTDDLKQIARVRIVTADYVTLDGKATATKELDLVMKAASGVDLYAAIVATGAPDFTAGDNFQIRLGFSQN